MSMSVAMRAVLSRAISTRVPLQQLTHPHPPGAWSPLALRTRAAPGTTAAMRKVHGGSPAYAIADTFRSAMETARSGTDEKREQAVFDKQMELLCDRGRVFDGDRFLDLLVGMKDASGMGGLKEHLPWVQNNPALGEIKDQQAVIHAMAPAERRHVVEIGIAAKKRISRATGQSLDAIEAVISQIGTMRRIQQWLARRADAGTSPPSSSKQLQVMLSAPDSGMSRKQDRGAAVGRERPGVNQRRKRR